MLDLFGDDRLLSPKDSDYESVDRLDDDRDVERTREEGMTVTDVERTGGEN